MKNLNILLLSITVVFASCVKDRIQPPVSNVVNTTGDSLIYYWDFNDQDSSNHAPVYTSGGAATFQYSSSYVDYTSGSGLNLRNTSDTGSALRVRNPSQYLVFKMPTTGYKAIVMKYAVQRSSSGPALNAVSYTTDGTNYVTTAINNNSSYAVDTVFELHAFDFSSDAAVNNNPNFAVKVTFTNNNTGSSGNDRFDNVSLEGVKQ